MTESPSVRCGRTVTEVPPRALWPEPAWVIEQVADRSGQTQDASREFILAAHHVVDSLVTDDYLVVAFPLIVGRAGCPVWERFRYVVKGEWPHSLDLFDGPREELAKALSLPESLLERYPTAGLGTILVDTADLLARTTDAEVRLLNEMLMAWIDTYQLEGPRLRSYQVQPAGRERAFEDWLIQHMDVLHGHGYSVRLADKDRDGVTGRQVPLDGRRSVADLVCVVKAPASELLDGDLLVVENKATAVDSRAVDQLARYVDLLGASTHIPVHGLLIADGLSVDAGRALSERGFGYLSLASVGYRDYLRSTPARRKWDGDATSVMYPTELSIAGSNNTD